MEGVRREARNREPHLSSGRWKWLSRGLNRAGSSRWTKEILRRHTDRAGDEVSGTHVCGTRSLA